MSRKRNQDEPAPGLPRWRRAAFLVLCAVGVGIHLLWSEATGSFGARNLPYLPLLVPLQPDVHLAPGSAWAIAERAVLFLGPLLVAARLLTRRQLAWLAALAVLGLPAWRTIWPGWTPWLFAAFGGVAAWRQHRGAALVLLGSAYLVDTWLVTGVYAAYGLRLTPTVLPALVLVAMAAAMLAWIARRRGDWLVALPVLPLILGGWAILLAGHAAKEHHDSGPAPGDCDELDVPLVTDLASLRGDVAWAVREVDRGLVVTGSKTVLLLDDQGREISRWDEAHGRIESIAGDADRLWVPTIGNPTRLEPQGDGMLAEFEDYSGQWTEMHRVTELNGEPWWTFVRGPVMLRGWPPVPWHLGGLHGLVATPYAYDESLYLGDQWSLQTIDPASMRTRLTRRFGPHQLAAAIRFQDHRLLRMELLPSKVRVVDLANAQADTVVRIGFPPRYAALGGRPEVLAAADFFGDTVVLVNPATGGQRGPFRVGGRPRTITWSERSGAFLGVSTCGLYRLEPDA